jgi:hypothetical protein
MLRFLGCRHREVRVEYPGITPAPEPSPPPAEEDKEENIEAIIRWQRIVRRLHRIRLLQRIFAYTGTFLQQRYPGKIRQELQLRFPLTS